MSMIHVSDRFGTVDLDTLAGVQTALKACGYDSGKIDGIDGPNTQAAVKAFQTATGIGVDGIAGPVTKKALFAAIEHAATPEATAESAMQVATDTVKNLLG